MRARQLSLLTSLAAAILLIISLDTKAHAQGSEWVLKQNSAYSGAQTIYLNSTQGCKLTTKGFSTLMVAPNWRVMLSNDRARSYCDMSFDDWVKKFSASGPDMKGAPIRRGTAGTVGGARAQQYFVDTKLADGRMAPMAEFWMCHDITAPSYVNYAITKLTGIPNMQGMPVRIYKYNIRDGSKTVALDTMSCQRTKLPAGVLQPPAGFQRVADEMDLVMADDSGELGDLLNSMQTHKGAH